MKKAELLIAGMLIALLAVLPNSGAGQDNSSAQDAGQQTDAAQAEEQGSEQQVADQQAVEQPAEAGGVEENEEESPSRFIPTEQISQDLGVTFPADI